MSWPGSRWTNLSGQALCADVKMPEREFLGQWAMSSSNGEIT